MAGSDYQFLLEVYNAESELLHNTLVKPDWLPAIEAARFQSLFDGNRPTTNERVIPAWNAHYGQPHVAGIRAVVTCENGDRTQADIPLQFFRPYAQSVAQTLVQAGVLSEGQKFSYGVKSYRTATTTVEAGASQGMSIERLNSSPLHGQRPISDFLRRVDGCEGAGSRPFPVFVPRRVLAEAKQLKDQAGANETGGILIGYLWQDPDTRIPFSEVTAFVPACHTIAASTRLTFTAETWADVRAAINLRGQGESYAGWLHSHPARWWCQCAEIEKKADCPYAREFFSADDCLLHRTVFYSAHHVAVVLGDHYTEPSGWETTISAYGWQSGVIEPRAFHVLEDEPA